MNASRFFSARDWAVAGITGGGALIVYWFTLAPGVTFENSGEWITAAYHRGVPHPPGYSAWTLLAWAWCHLVPVGNVAWRVNLFSAVTSAAACGLLALLVSRSGSDFCSRLEFWRGTGAPAWSTRLVAASAIGSGWLLAFSPALWSQAVVAEAAGLAALCWMGVFVTLYWWGAAAERRWQLPLAALIWGVGLTVDQTLVWLAVPVPFFVWLLDRELGRELLLPVLALITGVVGYWVLQPQSLVHEGSFSAVVFVALGGSAGYGCYRLWKAGTGWGTRRREVFTIVAAAALGQMLHGYLHLAARGNPPVNWGHCNELGRFLHHFAVGQLEKFHTERMVLQLWGQLNFFFDDLQLQFNVLFALAALLALFFFRDVDERDRPWIQFSAVAFLSVAVGVVFLANPAFERPRPLGSQGLFLACHCLYALWIGYGLILGLAYLSTRRANLQPAIGLLFVLPVISLYRYWPEAGKRGHDFGEQFGRRLFQPGGAYPAMEHGAVLLGGTDAGRFIPTYKIFVEGERRDLYVVTQSALTDEKYLATLRDQYAAPQPGKLYPPEPLWIPGEPDIRAAFARYVQELATRPRLPGEDVQVENGRVNVRGMVSVMGVSAHLTRELVERNQARHAFYVEESYVMPWMYPYLEPYGIILKLNREPLPRLTATMVANDHAYWEQLSAYLLGNPRFTRDASARAAFAKLRSAIAGLYAYRHMTEEATGAFEQAMALDPGNLETLYRFAQFHVDQGRYDAALAIFDRYPKRLGSDGRIQMAIEQVKKFQGEIAAIPGLEKQFSATPDRFDVAMSLARAYVLAQRFDDFDGVVDRLTLTPGLTSSEFIQLIILNEKLNRAERDLELRRAYTQRYPQDGRGWLGLAVVLAGRGDCAGARAALEQAWTLDGPDQALRRQAQMDPRLANCLGAGPQLQLPGATNATPLNITR